MQYLIDFFTNYGYFAVLFVLILCGFGLPIPEDITLVSGGIIAGLGYANPHIMLFVGMFGVLFGDSFVYWLGRIYGVKILRFPIIRKILNPKRMKLVREKFDKYGNRVLFTARFLPGLRTPIYLMAGITKRISYTRFFLLDFFAAIISVPIWIYLGYHGAANLDWIEQQLNKGKISIYILVAVVIVYILWKVYKAKTRKQLDNQTDENAEEGDGIK